MMSRAGVVTQTAVTKIASPVPAQIATKVGKSPLPNHAIQTRHVFLSSSPKRRGANVNTYKRSRHAGSTTEPRDQTLHSANTARR